jgi:hypothetical protein
VKEDRVKKSSFTEKQIAVALRQAEAGTPVAQSAATSATPSRGSPRGTRLETNTC